MNATNWAAKLNDTALTLALEAVGYEIASGMLGWSEARRVSMWRNLKALQAEARKRGLLH